MVENNVAPRPLLIGLCTETSAGSLLDAKNASLSLCDKLARAAVKRRQPVEPKPTDAPVQRKETLESRTPPSPCPPQPQRGKNPFRGKFFSQRWTLRPTCRPWSGL